MDFGTRLKEMLKQRELTQKDLAVALNISPGAVGNYVHGLREPDYATLKKIASYFQVSTDFLLGMDLGITKSAEENELLQIYRVLNKNQRSFLIEQAKLLINRSL